MTKQFLLEQILKLKSEVQRNYEYHKNITDAWIDEIGNLRKQINSLNEKIKYYEEKQKMYKTISNYVYGATPFNKKLYMQIRCNSGHSFKIANVVNIDFDTDAFYVHYYENGELNFNTFPLDSYRIVNISF